MFYRGITLILLVIIVFASAFHSAESQTYSEMNQSIQEFFRSPIVFTQSQNELQISTGLALSKLYENWNSSIPFSLEYGITNKLEVEIEFPYNTYYNSNNERKSDFGNLEVGLMYNFTLNNNIIAISTLLDTELPTSGEGNENQANDLELTPMIVLGKQFGKPQIHASLGSSFSNGETSFLYNLAFVHPLSFLKTTFELSGLTGEDESLFLTPGIIYNEIDELELGIAFTKNIIEDDNNYGILLNIIYEFSNDE